MNVTIIDKGGIRSVTQDDYRAGMPVAEGYASAEPCPFPSSRHTAKQCREMGIKVGDTVVGREGDKDGRWWNETKLTLLWAGEEIAVFRVQRRSNALPKWHDDGEKANFTLDCRKWYLANAKLTCSAPSGGAHERKL